MTRALTVLTVLFLSTAALAQDNDAASANAQLAEQVTQALEAKDIDAAVTASQQLFASETHDKAWANNLARLPRLLFRADRTDEALAFFQARLAETDAEKLPRRGMSVTAYQLARRATDPDQKLALTKVATELHPGHAFIFNDYVKALVRAEQIDEALVACLARAEAGDASFESMRARRLEILAGVDRPDQRRAEAAAYLKVATDPDAALDVLPLALPPDDVALCAAIRAQKVFDGVKLSLRRETGRLHPETLAGLAEQLTRGGEARPLRISHEARQLAAGLTDAQAPLANYLASLLSGDYASAFNAAYRRAKQAESDGRYVDWIRAAAGAIRAHDQHYNGRALAFIRFVNGESDQNPVEEWVR